MTTRTVAWPDPVAPWRVLEPPAQELDPPKGVVYAVALAIATMPLLSPSGPGNTGLADVTICAALVTCGMWLHRHGGAVALPYSLGVGLLMLAGAVAAVHVDSAFSGLAIIQDLFSLLWGAVIANAVRKSPRLLRIVVGTWCWSGLAWASVLVAGKLLGLNALAGISAKDGGRASLTFNDPNLAGNYFLCVLFVLLATRVVRAPVVRALGVVVLLTAILFTGSNGAAVGLGIGLAVATAIRLRRNRGPIRALAFVAAAVVIVSLAEPHLDLSATRQKASDSVQLLRDSIGRSDESGSEREILWSEALNLYHHSDLIGVAPGETKATLAATSAPYVKEAHNDYMATLVERGALGGLGLALLLVTIGLRLGRVALRPLRADVAKLVPRPEMLLGLGCAFLAAAVFYEVLHFRHLWAFLGLVAGLDPGVRRPWRR